MSELIPVPPSRADNLPVPYNYADESFEKPEAASAGITPLQIALKRKWRILGFATVAAVLTGVIVKQLPVRYTASATVLVDTRQTRVANGENLLPSQAVDGDLVRTRIEALRSPQLAREVVQRLDLTNVPEFCAKQESWSETFERWKQALLTHNAGAPSPAAACHESIDKVVDRLTPTVTFNNDGRDWFVVVTAEAGEPEMAAKIANTYVAAFVDQQHRQQAGLSDQAEAWLGTHIDALRADLVKADAAVEQQRHSAQLTSVRGETLIAQSMAEINSQLSFATSDLAQKRSVLSSLDGLARSGGTAAASAPALASPIIQKLIDRESVLAAAQADMATRLGSANSEVIANAAQLDRVRQQIRTEVGKAVTAVRGEVDSLEARRQGLENSVKTLQAQVGGQGLASLRLQDLERDAASARSRYDTAANRLEQLRIEAATQRADVQPLNEAVPPKFPSFPRTRMIVVGTFMAALAAGVGLAFASALMARVFTDPSQVEQQTGLRVFGLFPRPPRRRTKPQDLTIDHPSSRECEALQAVLSSLVGNRYRGDVRLGWALMVTSALPGEGKTTFSVAVGRAAAARGLSVVIVDCDLRRSSMRRLFPALANTTASASIAGSTEPSSSWSTVAEPGVDASSGLHVLLGPAGRQNPHEVLTSKNLPRAIAQLRLNYDVIIIDTPPVLAVPDALTLSRLADDIVLLTEWGRSPRRAILSALKTMRRANVPVTGIVLSKVDLKRFAKNSGGDDYYAVSYPAYHGLSQA